jgi:hypothetical protein
VLLSLFVVAVLVVVVVLLVPRKPTYKYICTDFEGSRFSVRPGCCSSRSCH